MSSTILSINSNISSLRAQRQIGTATNALSSSFEKLSSGLRINRASDDAAGLSMASSLKADTRIYSQGLRNLNDGISALTIADGAIGNLSSIITRIEELAEQSANGAVGWKQRKSLDAEAQALAKEYWRISRTTDFNGLKLFDGTVQGLSLQAGYGSNGTVLSSLGGALGTGTFGSSLTLAASEAETSALALSDINSDGFADLITAGDASLASIFLGNGDGSFRAVTSMFVGINRVYALSLTDTNGDGVLDVVAAGEDGGLNGAVSAVSLGNGDGTFRSGISYQVFGLRSWSMAVSDINGDGIEDIATAGIGGAFGSASIQLGNGDGTFRFSGSYRTEESSSAGISLSDLNGDGRPDLVTVGSDGAGGYASIRLGNGDGTFRARLSHATEVWSFAVSVSDVNRDGIPDLLTAGSAAGSGSATIRLGNGDGTFKACLSYATETGYSQAVSTADVNGDGALDLATAGDSAATIRLGNGDGTFRASVSYETEGRWYNALAFSDLNQDGVLDLVTGGLDSDGYASVRLSNVKDGISPILPFSLETQAHARQALPHFQRALERLSMQRGQIGAFQSRLAAALDTLGSAVLEYKGAQSRVEDIDVAAESASLIRQQILQQAASGVLAQANQAPSLALMLLGG